MAKTKTQKELLASVRESTLARNYDLTRVDPREYAAPLQVLFHSEVWKDIFIRRNKLFSAAMHGDANAFKQIYQLDKKVAMLILQAMFHYWDERQKQINGETIVLNDYFNDFVRTPDQLDLYNEFSNRLDSVVLLADILEGILKDAQTTLKKLDPSLVLTEFDSIRAAVKALEDYTHLQHRDENPELKDLFMEYSDEVDEVLRMKTSLFVAKYKELRESLINNGKLQANTKKKHTDREYLTDLLANYFHNVKKKDAADTPAPALAKEVMKQFTDEELQEAMPTIIELYRHAESIHQARQGLNGMVKSLPETEVTKKIVKHIL